MSLATRLTRLERRAEERFQLRLAQLDEEGFVLEFLRQLERDAGRLAQDDIIAFLTLCGGTWEEWQETFESVLEQHYEPIPRSRGKEWRPKS